MSEPRQLPAVRARVMRGRWLANWLTIGTILLVLKSLAPDYKVHLAYTERTGWVFYLHLGSLYEKDGGEVASNRKPPPKSVYKRSR